MIGDRDHVCLAPGVTSAPDGLYDEVRGLTLPLNETGRIAVATLGTPATIAAALAERYGVEAAVARADARAFCAELNAKLLLDVAPRGRTLALVGRWLWLTLHLLPTGRLPGWVARRHALTTTRLDHAVWSVVRALWRPALALAAAVAAAVALLLAGLGVGNGSVVAAAAVTAALGLIVHEAAHVAALGRVPACLAVRGLGVFVLHRRLRRRHEAAVALAGPAAGVALALLTLAILVAAPRAEIAVAAPFFALQALGFTLATHDGRRICGF